MTGIKVTEQTKKVRQVEQVRQVKREPDWSEERIFLDAFLNGTHRAPPGTTLESMQERLKNLSGY